MDANTALKRSARQAKSIGKTNTNSVAGEKGDQGDFREITLITLLCCFDEEGQLLVFAEGQFLVFEERQFLLFEEGQFLVFEERQFLVFQEGQFLLFDQQSFERLKNREDGSDFDDFLTKSIATTRTKFRKKFLRRARRRRRRRRRRRCRRRGRVKSPFSRATLIVFSLWKHAPLLSTLASAAAAEGVACTHLYTFVRL